MHHRLDVTAEILQIIKRDATEAGHKTSAKGLKWFTKITYDALLSENYYGNYTHLTFRDDALYAFFLLRVKQ